MLLYLNVFFSEMGTMLWYHQKMIWAVSLIVANRSKLFFFFFLKKYNRLRAKNVMSMYVDAVS